MTNTNTATLTVENLKEIAGKGPLYLGLKKEEALIYDRTENISITAPIGSGGTNLANVILIQVAQRFKSLDSLVFVAEKTTDFIQFIENGAQEVTEPEDAVKKLKEMCYERPDKEQILYIENVDYFLDKTNHSILPFLLELITRRDVQVIINNRSHSKLQNIFETTLDATENRGEFIKKDDSKHRPYKVQVPLVAMDKA